MANIGELRRDQYGLLWIFTFEEKWEKLSINKTGEQASVTDLAVPTVAWPFAPEDDPTRGQPDPRITSRLDSIEMMVKDIYHQICE